MHGLFKDETGKKYGRWSVISYAGNYKWNCVCDCGTKKSVAGATLRNKTSVSCGCHKNEKTSNRNRKHGQALVGCKTVEYKTWIGIKKRCLNSSANNYVNYGGRGIKVCDRWLESFENFYADMGRKPSPEHSIDRIDVDGDYEPSNCRWATRREQMLNTRKQKRKKL
jgi:hypothetical protein